MTNPILKELFDKWQEYKKDPEVMYNPDPPLGVVYTFEGFWMWLLKKETK